MDILEEFHSDDFIQSLKSELCLGEACRDRG